MLLSRPPIPPLRPFISLLWASDDSEGTEPVVARRERVLPTGAMHLVFRISSDPLQLFEHAESATGHSLGHAIVGGARARCYVRDISRPTSSVGAMLRAGAARPLFGVSAAELSGRHTPLEELWGSAALAIRERLLELHAPECQLQYFESLLLERLPRVRGMHPAIASALERLSEGLEVRDIVAESGYSHRHFIALFEEAVGLTPKRCARVLRFRGVLAALANEPRRALAELALSFGYADQPHLNKDFREMAGISPSAYRRSLPRLPHHVPCGKPIARK